MSRDTIAVMSRVSNSACYCAMARAMERLRHSARDMADRPVIITPKLFKRALKTERVVRPKREKVPAWQPTTQPKPTPPKR